MTFKKDFKQQMVPEWEKEYMDYEGLKRILKEIKKTASKLHTIGPCITGSDLKGHSVEYTCKVAIIRERGILRTKL